MKQSKADKRGNLLRSAFRQCRSNVVAVIVFSFFLNLLVFVGPLYMLQIYDRVLASRSEVTLVVLTGIAIALLVSYGLLEVVRSRVLVRTGAYFDDLISGDILHRSFTGQIRRPGPSYSQMPRDVDSLREFITGSGIIAFCDAPWVPIFIAMCFLLHFWLGVVALSGALIILGLAILNETLTRRTLSEASSARVAANQHVGATMRNAETIHAMGMYDGVLRRWKDMHIDTLALQATASDRAGIVMGSLKAVRMSLQVAILGVGAFLVIQGDVTPGTMIAASIIMGRALAPVEAAVGQWRQFVGARSAYKRLHDLVDNVSVDDKQMALPAPQGAISLERLVVAPPGSTVPTLKGVTLSIEPGEVIAVMGASGAGKSSLARAMVGVWQPASGAIRLDGAEIRQWDPQALGPHIGYLPQEVELFAGTIAENIARFGNVDAEAVIAAARIAGAHDLILRLPKGYETEVGESGRSLSGGQRQRIALARALYGDPAIIVLDEPNSSLDQEGEKALANAITWAKQQGRTVIVVSHRTSLLTMVDKVAVILDGGLAKFDRPEAVFGNQVRGQSNVAALRPNQAPAGTR